METNKELLLKLVEKSESLRVEVSELRGEVSGLAQKQLEDALEFSDYKNKQELKWQKIELYLESNPDTNQEGAIEKLSRIDKKLTTLEKEFIKKSAAIGGVTATALFFIKWAFGKIL